MFPQIFGKYVLEREIAAGGMARVYLATLRGAVGFEKRLVVKQIRPELASDDAFVARFVEEAKTTVELSHPNIVPVYELGVEQGIYYIALEFCEGITLADLLSLTGPLEPEQGAYVGVEICRALDYAHRRAGVVHRDVTPRNVLIDEEGAVRLIDFGIAERARAPAKPEDTEIFGSPGHMPPEQIRGDALTSATDVFAVGALLFEAWTGKAAYRRPKVADAYVAVHTRPAPLGEQVAALRDLDSVLHDALAPEPAERLQGADDLSRPLRDFLRQSDLGDLALRLGDRVRHARRKARGSVASIPDLERAGSEADVVTPAGEGTATFAANDEIQVWTRKLDKLPPEAADVEDLLVVSQRNPEPDSGATRRLEKPSESGPATRRISSPPASEPTGSGLEVTTGPGAGQNPRPAGARLSIVLALAAGLAGFGIAALFFFPKDEVAPAGAAQPTAAAGAVSSPISAQKTAVEAAPEPSAEPAHLPKPRPAPAPAAMGSSSAQQGKGTTPSSGSAPAPVAETSARAPAGTATLSLTSVPPAQVSVAGRARGTTPVMGLSLPAGTHGVVFQSPALGESVPTSVRLAPGQKRSIHVDFTGASPRVIVR